MQKTAPEIRFLPIESLHPNPRNARTHSRKQLKKIAASIRNCGFIGAIIVDDKGMILAGHGRWLAAQMVGHAEVPTVTIDHLSAARKRAYVLADNRIAEQAGWDRELLAIEFGELGELLPAEGLDISLTGFDAGEIDAIIADMEEGKLDPADMPLELPETPVSCRGDLWILGKHRLLCGDARSTRDVQRLMGGETAAAVITDPPFNRAMRDIGGRGKVKHSDFACASGEMSTSEFNEFNRTTLGNAVQVSAHGAIHYVFTDWRHVRELLEVTDGLYSEMLNLCVWTRPTQGRARSIVHNTSWS
jgi:hypothetical protein